MTRATIRAAEWDALNAPTKNKPPLDTVEAWNAARANAFRWATLMQRAHGSVKANHKFASRDERCFPAKRTRLRWSRSRRLTSHGRYRRPVFEWVALHVRDSRLNAKVYA